MSEVNGNTTISTLYSSYREFLRGPFDDSGGIEIEFHDGVEDTVDEALLDDDI